MSLRNYFYRFGKYILTFFFVTLLMVLFGPLQAQAAITKAVTTDGFKLSGTGSMNVWDGDEFRYYIGYQIPHEDSMDYKVDVTMTFQSSGLTPGRASVYLDDDSIPLYSNGGTVLQGSATFSKSDEMELMEIFVNYDSFPSEQNVDFSISVNVRENRKNADIAIYPPENNYDKTTGVFLVTVDDPYVFYSNKDSSKYSVSISDSSVAQVTGITPKSNDSFVAKTVITVSSYISLKVGDTTMFSNYVFKTGGGSITIKKVKSSNKKIVDAAGGFLIAKKPGTAKVSALVNGKRRTITVIVGKKPAPKPKLKQLQVKVKGYKYYPDSGKTIYTTRFTNKSKSTITKVKLKFTMTINEEMTRTKTFKVNIKPGKTKTMKLNIGKLIADPSNITVKCLKFWYKS